MNYRSLFFTFVIGFTICFPRAQAMERAPSAVNSGKLQRLVQSSGFRPGDLGLWVGVKGESGLQTVFAQNAVRPMVPASLSKIITAGTVIETLQPGFHFKTELLSKDEIHDGTLKGSLYLKGGGDPSFVSENMWTLVDELSAKGLVKISGDVLVDDTRFDSVRVGEDRENARVDRAYDAPIGAMSMNWNSVNVFVRPGDKPGDPLKVFLDPMSPYLKLRNETQTVAAGRGQDIAVERIEGEHGFVGDVIRVRGKMALGHDEVVVYKNITQPDLWSGYNLIEFLRQRGITVSGSVKKGRAPTDAQVLATYASKPLALIVADMAKFSNNYVAEMLVKNLAAETSGTPATMPQGMAQIQKFLEERGFKKGSYHFINASGFTLENKLSPEQFGRFLEMLRNDFSSFPEFLTALPIAGIDGTLRKRMKNTPAERWVRAKTGLLNGVVGLAGFAGKSDGRVLSFAFIFNGSGREDKARALFDHLAATLVEE